MNENSLMSSERILAAIAFSFAAVLAAAMVVWWLVASAREVDAQAAIEGACVGLADADAVEKSIRYYVEGDIQPIRMEISGNDYSYRLRFYLEGELAGDVIAVMSDPELLDASDTEDIPDKVEVYLFVSEPPGSDTWVRNLVESKVDRDRLKWELDLTDGSSGTSFCGYPTDILTDLAYLGDESVDGVKTRHFSGTVEPHNVPAAFIPEEARDSFEYEEGIEFEWWIGLDGYLVRQRATILQLEAGIEITYSNWNEPPGFSIPEVWVDATPMPTP